VSVRGFKSTSTNKTVNVAGSLSWDFNPQSYISALLAETLRHGHRVFDPEPKVPLRAPPPADTERNSVSPLRPVSVFICLVFIADDKSRHSE